MKYFDKLVENRKGFIYQLYNLLINQFENTQQRLSNNEEEMIDLLEDDYNCIQRIFINAPWGTGKTYFGKALEELIENENDLTSNKKKIKLIKINAWEADYYFDPMKSLMAEIFEVVSDQDKEKIQEYFESLVKIGGKKILKTIVKTLMGLVIGKENCESILEVCKSIVSELPENEDFFKDYKEYREILLKFKETLSKSEGYKVIIIDELDRCRPTYAIELLETIKHIFGVKNIIFIFLVNKAQLSSTISTIYFKNKESDNYFEKFYDIEFTLPEIKYEDFIKLEYEKYNSLNTNYKKREMYLEKLFLDIFKSNLSENMKSIRYFRKIFEKYKFLLRTLSEEEKKCYPLVIFLAIYFFREEMLVKEKNDLEIYLKTFFLLKNDEAMFKEDIFLSEDYIVIKEEYKKQEHYYKIIAEIMFYKNGSREIYPNMIYETGKNYDICILESDLFKYEFLEGNFKNESVEITQEIENNDLYWNIICDGNSLEGHLILNKDILDINSENRDFSIIDKWCLNKYYFIRSIK